MKEYEVQAWAMCPDQKTAEALEHELWRVAGQFWFGGAIIPWEEGERDEVKDQELEARFRFAQWAGREPLKDDWPAMINVLLDYVDRPEQGVPNA